MILAHPPRSSSSLILRRHPPSACCPLILLFRVTSLSFSSILLSCPPSSPLLFSLVTPVPQRVPSTCFLPSSLFLIPRPPPSSASPTPPCLIHHLHLFPSSLQELRSHDPSSLPSDYELPRSSAGHRPSVGPASAQLRPSCDPAATPPRRE